MTKESLRLSDIIDLESLNVDINELRDVLTAAADGQYWKERCQAAEKLWMKLCMLISEEGFVFGGKLSKSGYDDIFAQWNELAKKEPK